MIRTLLLILVAGLVDFACKKDLPSPNEPNIEEPFVHMILVDGGTLIAEETE